MNAKQAPKKRPLVTIGMPIYNEERFLEHAIESLRNQDYQNI
jgi:glycosyltransferase involved in cell wall biosynthesis